MKKQIKGILLIIAGSFGFGVMPSLALNAYTGGINVMTMLALKYTLVCVIMFPVVILRHKIHQLPKAALVKIFVLSATLYTAQATLYAFSVTLIPVALAALVLFTYPIQVSLIGALVFKEKFSLSGKLWLGAAFLGLVLLFIQPMDGIQPLGVVTALGASLSYAVYVVLLDRVTAGSNIQPMTTNALLNAGAAFTVVIISLLTGQLNLVFTPITWVYVLYNGIFVGIIAYWLWLMGMRELGSVKASVLSMSEPVFASLASVILLDQRLGAAEIVGGAVLLVAVTMFVNSQSHLQASGQGTPQQKHTVAE